MFTYSKFDKENWKQNFICRIIAKKMNDNKMYINIEIFKSIKSKSYS